MIEDRLSRRCLQTKHLACPVDTYKQHPDCYLFKSYEIVSIVHVIRIQLKIGDFKPRPRNWIMLKYGNITTMYSSFYIKSHTCVYLLS